MLACWRVVGWDDNNSLWGASVWNVWLFLKYIPCLKYLPCLLTPSTHPVYHHTLSTYQLPAVHVHTMFLLENRLPLFFCTIVSSLRPSTHSSIHPFHLTPSRSLEKSSFGPFLERQYLFSRPSANRTNNTGGTVRGRGLAPVNSASRMRERALPLEV